MATSEQIYAIPTFSAAGAEVAPDDFNPCPARLNQRLEPRGLAVMPAVIRADGQENVGLLRDISQTGMFFYCSLNPPVGSKVEVLLRPSAADPAVAVRCRCRVVRTEPSRAGAATGIGVAIEEYLGETARAEADAAEDGRISC
jgi:hypothetical protein